MTACQTFEKTEKKAEIRRGGKVINETTVTQVLTGLTRSVERCWGKLADTDKIEALLTTETHLTNATLASWKKLSVEKIRQTALTGKVKEAQCKEEVTKIIGDPDQKLDGENLKEVIVAVESAVLALTEAVEHQQNVTEATRKVLLDVEAAERTIEQAEKDIAKHELEQNRARLTMWCRALQANEELNSAKTDAQAFLVDIQRNSSEEMSHVRADALDDRNQASRQLEEAASRLGTAAGALAHMKQQDDEYDMFGLRSAILFVQEQIKEWAATERHAANQDESVAFLQEQRTREYRNLGQMLVNLNGPMEHKEVAVAMVQEDKVAEIACKREHNGGQLATETVSTINRLWKPGTNETLTAYALHMERNADQLRRALVAAKASDAAVRAADHAAATIRATVENAAGNATETLRQITSHAACAVNKAGAARRNERKTFEDEKAALAVIIRSAEDYAKEIESMAAKLVSAAQGLLSDLGSSISVLQKREQDLVYNVVLGKNHTSSGAHDMKKQHALVLGDAALRDEKDQTAAVSLAEELQKTASADIALGATCGQSIAKQVPVLHKEAQDSETRGMWYGSLLATVARVLISKASERHAEAMDLVRLRERTQAIRNEIYAEQARIARVAETLRRIQREAFAKRLTLIMRTICSHSEKKKSLNERSAKLTDEATEMETRASEIYRQNAPTAPPRAKQSEQYAKVTSLLASANARIAMTKTELNALSKQSSDGSDIERKERNSKQGAVPAGKNALLENLNKTAWEVLARVTFKREQEGNEGICKSTRLNEIVEQLTDSHAATMAANETEDAMRRIFAVLGRHLHHAKNTLKHAFEAKKLAMRALLSAREFENQSGSLPLHAQLLDILARGSEVTENDKDTPKPSHV
ncbi:hypothetical protein, conserved in T. vivax [Trypanosoma vivax Y486]|uniref:Uncharacterized protein n=1 Tax=Trypanosoma vivax (strain Y486) TaxID=1055687 RepID=F9WRL2_TRYVY|nr:hypothetical protein, conserved in T. vivax [Trypanosoma vivax Y486]|eukprot:CCD20196.1 hypothetical protein, conserved in T. vivax [Trypanosoma vivax Y486]